MLRKDRTKLVAVVIAVVVLAAGYAVHTSPRAFAQLSVQINPEIVLTLDRNHRVLKAEFKGVEGHQALADLALVNLTADAALAKIATTLSTLNLLQAGREVMIVVIPARGVTTEQVAPLALSAEKSLKTHMKSLPTQVPVAQAFVGTELYAALSRRAIPLASFSRFLRDGLTEANLAAIVALQTELALDASLFAKEFRSIVKSFMDLREVSADEKGALDLLKVALQADPSLQSVYHTASALADMTEAGIAPLHAKALLALRQNLDPIVFRKEVDSLTSAFIDMYEVGINPTIGLATIAAAIKADPLLEELDTITSALVDLIERGIPVEEAVLQLNAAMVADPTLQNLDDLLGLENDRGRGKGKRDQDDKSRDNKKDAADDQEDEDEQEKERYEDTDEDEQEGQGKRNAPRGKKTGN
ncbi:MAG: hypothetical protein DDT35_00502 [Firmicutes bacterium]|nr:hypothetical protein [Bacillota bacterium]